MSLRRTVRLALVAAVAVMTASAQAWNAVGHMVIAAIADRQLSPAVRDEVARLAKIGADPSNEDPFGAAVWADDVRRDRPASAPWHYINLFFRKDGKLPVGKPETENVVVAINRFSAVLADRTKPDAERAEALRFLMHFVGDIHQPLHAVAFESDAHPDGDRGGNSYAILPVARFGERSPKQLHALWDLGVGLFTSIERPLTPEGTAAVRREADTLIALLPATAFADRGVIDPQKWAEESIQIAKDVVYTVPEGTTPTDAYLEAGQQAAAKRVTLAGYRLGDMLEKILGKTSG